MPNADSQFTDFTGGDDLDMPARDHIPVRSLRQEDMASIVRVDKRVTGQDRTDFYQLKINEALDESGIRVSLVAEIDDHVAGFLMARVDFGEFGRTESVAAIDTIDVDPLHRGRGVGQALMSQLKTNLTGLRVDTMRTNVDWNHLEMIAFFDKAGFKPSQRIAFVKKL